MLSLKHIYQNLINISSNFRRNNKEIQELKLLIAKNLSIQAATAKNILEAEFKVFSQWGDDGIIQYLIQNVKIENKIFIEFGVENYTESNTRFLLMNNNWKGLIMDGSEEHVNFIKKDDIYWKYDLTALAKFITAENINDIISGENISGNIGILHIDIDGNDYWVWKSITVVDADIVIVEYNSVFGSDRSITIPYQDSFHRTGGHFSNLFYGTSITSICDLAEEKGYFFVGCNSAGNNAYFVKKNKIGNIKPLTIKEGFVDAKFRESRDKNGQLSFLAGKKREEAIKGLKVFNTRTNVFENI